MKYLCETYEIPRCTSRGVVARRASGLLAEHPIELRVAAEAGFHGGGQRRGVFAVAVGEQEPAQSLPVAVQRLNGWDYGGFASKSSPV